MRKQGFVSVLASAAQSESIWHNRPIRLTDGGFWSSFFGGMSSSGRPVGIDSAMKLSAVWSCVRLVSMSVAGLPIGMYKRKPDGSRENASDHSLYSVIHVSPNADMTPMQFWQAMVAAMMLWGNAYAKIGRVGGRVVALDFLLPSRVRLDCDNDGRLKYLFTPKKGGETEIKREDMLHIPAFSLDGRVGMSAIRYGVDVMGAALSAEDAANSTFKNGLMPTVAFSVDRTMNKAQRDEFREYVQAVSGALNSGKSPVLEHGVKPEAIGINPVDAQLLESRGWSVQEVCFVPGTKILTLDGFKSIESICVGESVLTHKGRWRRVRNVMRRSYSGSVITSYAKGLNAVTSTPNHPFYAQKVKPNRSHKQEAVGTPQWVDAGDMRASVRGNDGRRGRGEFHAVTIPKIAHDVSIVRLDMAEWADSAAKVDEEHVLASSSPRANPVRRHPSLDSDFGWLCGVYASDGSSTDHQVIFYLGAHEKEAVRKLHKALFGVFGVRGVTKIVGSVARTVVNSKILAQFFVGFGTRADLKVLPNFALVAPPAFREGIISGLIDGDGCVYKDRCLLRTTSERLAWQLRMMLWTDGLHGAICVANKKTWNIEGRSGSARPIYTVEWRPDRRRRGSMGQTDEIAYFGLDRVDNEEYIGYVYNLEVEDDESYTTEGGCVHNCRWFGVPPWMVGYTDKGSNWGTGLEQQMLAFLTFVITSYTTQIQQCVNKRLLEPKDWSTYYAEYSLEGFLKADSAARASFYSAMAQNGIYTRDDIRVKENLPRKGGNAEVLTVQSNLVPIDKLGESSDSNSARAALSNWLKAAETEE